MNKKTMTITLVVVLIITALFATFLFMKSNQTKAYEQETYTLKEIGETKHLKENKNTYNKSIFYPTTKYETLNKAIERFTNGKPSYKTNDKFIYYVDYEANEVLNQYINVIFYITIYNENEKPLTNSIHSIVYDVKNDNILSLHDIFRKDYENMIKTQLHQNKKSSNIKNITNLRLYKDSVTLYLNNEKNEHISIPFEAIKPYIKLSNKGIPSLFQEEREQNKKPNIDPNKPMVALTFDDGPNPINTPRVMEALEKNNANATFFVLGTNVNKFPDLIKTMDKKGFEIGSHTFHHRNLANLSQKETYDEIMNTQDAIYALIGKDPTLMRPPYGSLPNIKIEDYHLSIALWSIDTLDWKSRNPSAIQSNVLNNIQDGAIILMHDIYDSSAQAVEQIVPLLKQRGFQIVDLSTLIKYRYS